jgi:hypothetical protein
MCRNAWPCKRIEKRNADLERSGRELYLYEVGEHTQIVEISSSHAFVQQP